MLKIINNIILAILAIVFVSACARDDFDDTPLQEQGEISFAASSAKLTRAGESSLANYVSDFRIYGVNTRDLIFDNYVVWHDNASSQSNTNGWEYVGSPDGIDISREDGSHQGVKYWNYTSPQYTFWAVAASDKGKFTASDKNADGTIKSFVTADAVTPANVDNLFFTKPTVVEKAQYDNPVVLKFMRASSRVRFAFYETVPGYKVKNVTFTDAPTPVLDCSVEGKFVTSGKLKLTYDNASKKVATGFAEEPETETAHTFGTLQYTDDVLGTVSSSPTYAAGDGAANDYYTSILPFAENDTPLTLTISYTLVAEDASGHEIDVENVTAIVPVEYCKWEPNRSYTYLFKFTDSQLHPITFDAYYVVDDIDGSLGTITMVGDYNITTYQSGSVVDDGVGYQAGIPVDIKIFDNSGKTVISLAGGATPTDYVLVYESASENEWTIDDATTTSKEVSYDEGTACFTPDAGKFYRIEYWHDSTKIAVKMLKTEPAD